MMVLEPLAVQVRGLGRWTCDFQGGDRRLARLTRRPWPARARLELADGSRYEIVPSGRWRPVWLLWHGERECGQGRPHRLARRAELVYEAVPYFILPEAPRARRYGLINEADTRVLTIAFRSPLRREAELCPQVALDLALVVFAYELASRLL